MCEKSDNALRSTTASSGNNRCNFSQRCFAIALSSFQESTSGRTNFESAALRSVPEVVQPPKVGRIAVLGQKAETVENASKHFVLLLEVKVAVLNAFPDAKLAKPKTQATFHSVVRRVDYGVQRLYVSFRLSVVILQKPPETVVQKRWRGLADVSC